MITFILILLLVAAAIGLFAAVALCMIIGIASLWGYNRHRKKLCQELHAAYQFPWPDDATTCQRVIDRFLCDAQKSIADPSEESKLWKMPDRRSEDINFFIRMCHALGCEIVIRRVANHDIEEDPDNPMLVKARDFVENQ